MSTGTPWLLRIGLIVVVALAIRGGLSIIHDGLSPEWLWERPW